LQQTQASKPVPAGLSLAAFVAQVQVFASQGFLPQDAAQALTTNIPAL
jgi:hypothetical protein